MNKILKLRNVLAAFFLSALMMTSIVSKGEDYCSGIKVIKGHYIEEDEDGGIAVIIICDCGPGFC